MLALNIFGAQYEWWCFWPSHVPAVTVPAAERLFGGDGDNGAAPPAEEAPHPSLPSFSAIGISTSVWATLLNTSGSNVLIFLL